MPSVERLKKLTERLLESIVLALVGSLTVIVTIAVIYRKVGASLSWYDEVASIMLAWLTYYGSALAALKRSHIGFPGLINKAPAHLKLPLFVLGESIVFGFFAILAWVGWQVVIILQGDTLVSLTWVPSSLTQSVIPIGAMLFIIAQALSLPGAWQRLAAYHPKPQPRGDRR